MDLKKTLSDHQLWLETRFTGTIKGARADLHGANLRNANLRNANLYGADLRSADLRIADLYGANLYCADLRGAELLGANLCGADLRSADLYCADLHGANLHGANLHGANLRSAILPHYQIPDGEIVGWKAVRGAVLKLLIKGPRTASLVGRKCRAKSVKVLAAFSAADGKRLRTKKFTALYDGSEYVVGKTRTEARYNDDCRIECTTGLHFFLTRKEAEEYGV